MTLNASIPASVDRQIRSLLGPAGWLTHPVDRLAYESDAFTLVRGSPWAIALPQTTAQVAEVLKILHRAQIPVIPRGAGTGLCGGATPLQGGVILGTSRLNQIHRIEGRWALVDAGVANLALSQALSDTPLHFAPDPSSQRAATIGGNAATNAGGIHTLKYGVSVNHILGLELVLADGSIHQLGGPFGHDRGLDLVGFFCGTEGTLGVITRLWCRLTSKPAAFCTAQAFFRSPSQACAMVAAVTAAGILPAALEMMDGAMLSVLSEAYKLDFPPDAAAALLVELDGVPEALDRDLRLIAELAEAHEAQAFTAGREPERRAEIWSTRKKAFGAIGRLSPAYCTQDACVPRSLLPQVIEQIAQIGARYQLRISNVFHAGDGNVHPVLLYDERNPGEVEKVLAASGEILRYCLSIGGTITGEHGVGIEKLPYMAELFSPLDLQTMGRIREALGAQRLNPGKVFESVAETQSLPPQTSMPATPWEPATLEACASEIKRLPSGWQVEIGSHSLIPKVQQVLRLSTRRLNRLKAHWSADMTVCVEAGMSLSALQSHLRAHRQWLPIDPPGRGPSGERTLGSLVASNALGPLSYSMGDWRLFLLGVRWVDAQGRILRSGGRTIKNVAGYPVHRLLIGSMGGWGLLGELTLRTYALPEDEQAWVAPCRDAQEAKDLLAQVMQSPLNPSWLELLAPQTARELGLPTTGGPVLLAGFLETPEICQLMGERLQQCHREFQPLERSATDLREKLVEEPEGAAFHLFSSQVAEKLMSLEGLLGSRLWAVSEAGRGMIRGVIRGERQAEAIEQLEAWNQQQKSCQTPRPQLTWPRMEPALLREEWLKPHPLAQHFSMALDPQHRWVRRLESSGERS